MGVNDPNRGWGDFFEEPPPKVRTGEPHWKKRGPAKNALPVDFEQRVRDGCADGMLDREIAAAVGCSTTSVSNCRRRLGLPSSAPDRRYTEDELRLAAEVALSLAAYRKARRELAVVLSAVLPVLAKTRSVFSIHYKASALADKLLKE